MLNTANASTLRSPVSAALLAVGTAAVFPFEMDTVVSLSDGKLVATHYGFYNTVVGVGILVGNLATGAVVGAARDAGAGWIVWFGLSLIGVVAAFALHRLDRTQRAPHPDLAHRARGAASGDAEVTIGS